MITDQQTNKLYLADSLEKLQPVFFKRFEKLLNECNIPFKLLKETKDIWAVDYMPIQVSNDKFVQFKYNPDYLQDRLWKQTISNTSAICKAIGKTPKVSKLIIDGGNVVRGENKVIMCDKVFHENHKTPEKEIIKQLKELFNVDKLIFLPWDVNDMIGHADGMVRFINNDTVFINDYSESEPELQTSFRMALNNAGIDWVEFPYYPTSYDPASQGAEGLYINYLQMEKIIIMPTFENKNDDKAFKILQTHFKDCTIKTVDSREIAKEGGVLNCITWNILE